MSRFVAFTLPPANSKEKPVCLGAFPTAGFLMAKFFNEDKQGAIYDIESRAWYNQSGKLLMEPPIVDFNLYIIVKYFDMDELYKLENRATKNSYTFSNLGINQDIWTSWLEAEEVRLLVDNLNPTVYYGVAKVNS